MHKLYEVADPVWDKQEEGKTLTSKEEELLLLLHMDGQVKNGGFAQWVDNGYASEGKFTATREALKALGTQTAKTIDDMVAQLEEYIIEDAECKGFFGNYWVVERDEYTESCGCGGDEDCVDCDGTGEIETEEESEPGRDLAMTLDSPYYDLDDGPLDDLLKYMNDEPLDRIEWESTEKAPKRPRVKLIGTDGNAFAIIGKVSQTLKKAGLRDRVKEFQEEATSGDYNHLLNTAMKYCEVY